MLKALFAQHARASRDERPRQPLEDIAGLRKHATLTHVNVLAVAKQKRAYLGFSFGCSWDGEHGAGVMIHKRRRVTDGGADHAFLGWLAKRDGGAALNAASPDREPRAGAKASLTPSTKAKPKPKPSTKPKTTSAKPKTSTGAKRKPRAKAKRSS
ncbi:MAG: hypothetical protein JNK04_14825 [Myxococcales bacterium]|nr:hypothetical protein [Myxococcales bacterium]